VSRITCFCISSGKARSRKGLPLDLAREIEDVRQKGEEVREVSTGLDGDWFLRTDRRHGTSGPTNMHSHFDQVCPSLTETMPQRSKGNTTK
jgi:hypothetical protein